MFNVTKALKKLDEKFPDRNVNFYPYVSCKELREVILAGQYDEVEKKLVSYWERMNAMVSVSERIEDEFRGTFSKIEERLARLERNARCCDNGLFGEEHDCQKKDPSKPTELNKACEEFYKGNGWKPLGGRQQQKQS